MENSSLCFSVGRQTQTLQRKLRPCFLASFFECGPVVEEKKKCISQSEARAAVAIGLENTNLVKDVEILLLVKFVEFRCVVAAKKLKL